MCPRCVHCFVSLLLQKLAKFPLTLFLTSPSIRYPYCPGFFHSPFHSSLHGPQGPQVKRLKFEITNKIQPIPFNHGWWFGTWILRLPYIGNVIIPTDDLIFFRGVGLNHQPEPSWFTHWKWWTCHSFVTLYQRVSLNFTTFNPVRLTSKIRPHETSTTRNSSTSQNRPATSPAPLLCRHAEHLGSEKSSKNDFHGGWTVQPNPNHPKKWISPTKLIKEIWFRPVFVGNLPRFDVDTRKIRFDQQEWGCLPKWTHQNVQVKPSLISMEPSKMGILGAKQPQVEIQWAVIVHHVLGAY